ncbi:M48 family metalloprotease [Arcobacter sp. CECT 8985]|uniref:M48 family metalloprotease n=1 Tax=Arcobacter sp. CECT 8985 TaxID=1935424 RepID=UPI00100AF353|nr:M48 family metalloprotease [Arcobacter sp. CECT 8985]RXJ86058.1 hypothetical protein CRU93_10380 [Arcobacter sp. CECT 8985]
MKKLFICYLTLINFLFAFDFGSITSSLSKGIDSASESINSAAKSVNSVVKDSISNLNNSTSTTNTDLECKKPIENYNFNYIEALKIASMYYGSKSSKIINFISNKNTNKEDMAQDIKQLSIQIAKKTIWLPTSSEKIYGKYIFDKRKEKGDVIDKNTKNHKYKNMYKKLEIFTKKYNNYLKKNKYLENNKFPFNIKIYITSNNNQVEAIPGGYIFISEDYIKENRYKTALAHELTHISKRHTTKELQYRLINGYDSIDEIKNLIKNVQTKEYSTLSKISTALAGKDYILKLFSRYSQSQELEADSCSLKILTDINHKNKNKYIKELVKNIDLTIQNEQESKNEILNMNIEEHPDKKKRIANIKSLAVKI